MKKIMFLIALALLFAQGAMACGSDAGDCSAITSQCKGSIRTAAPSPSTSTQH